METKPGVKTTEFWISLIASLAGPIVAILITLGVASPDIDPAQFSNQLSAALAQIADQVVALVALFTGVAGARTYTSNRSQVKVASTQAAVLTAKVNAAAEKQQT